MAGDGFTVRRWFEHVETALSPEEQLGNGRGVVYRQGAVRYLAAWPDAALLARLFARMAGEAGLAIESLPVDVRTRRAGGLRFAFNYGAQAATLPNDPGRMFVIGGAQLPPAGVAVWRED
jgi:beta-galactosidase